MSVPGWGVFNPSNETGKFYIGDELVICTGLTEFLEHVKVHMGQEAADYLEELVDAMIEKIGEEGYAQWAARKIFPERR